MNAEYIEEMRRQSSYVAYVRVAVWPDRFVWHTDLYIALVAGDEAAQEENHPSMSHIALDPWVVQLDANIQDRLGMSLTEWVNLTRDFVVLGNKDKWREQLDKTDAGRLFKRGCEVIYRTEP